MSFQMFYKSTQEMVQACDAGDIFTETGRG